MLKTFTAVIKLLRVDHYIKNALCFLPLIFSGKLFHGEGFVTTLLGAAAFSALSSCVYIYNDLCDIKFDRHHPRKCRRPLASGELSPAAAWLLLGTMATLMLIPGYLAAGTNWQPWAILAAYAVSNLCYSRWLKHIVLVDVGVIASGFLLRLFYGAGLLSIPLSAWMFLTILAASLFMGLGKRRNEMLCEKKVKTRSVLNGYSWNFLDRNMYIMMSLTIVFYALWTINSPSRDNSNMKITPLMWTIPGVIFLLMRYSLIIERGAEGDPTRVLFSDRVLLVLSVLLGGTLVIMRNAVS
ncbi:MAG: UbiA prenyltransferase family protein [Victivallales bacterium]|nr:UbiA prenyltransferase family protein [Victivallales bacterium]